MNGENNVARGKLKGYMFEIILTHFLKNNNFSNPRNNFHEIRESRVKFTEVKGRGTWHEIDILLDYETSIPFFFPIRLFGEVKCYEKPITKSKIREFIAVLKDIQENYVINENSKDLVRSSELGVFFSASGFNKEAENLAYSHNIKTISYAHNPIIRDLISLIKLIESNCLYTSCLSKYSFNNFIESFTKLFLFSDIEDFIQKNDEHISNKNLLRYNLNILVNKVHSEIFTFIGTTSSGFFFHFFSSSPFPEDLFSHQDEQTCRILYEPEEEIYYLKFSNDDSHNQYFFTPPEVLKDSHFKNKFETLNIKESIFNKLYVNRSINGISRNLIISIDNDWLNSIRYNLNKRTR